MALALQYIHHFGIDRKDEAHAELHRGGCSAKEQAPVLQIILSSDRIRIIVWKDIGGASWPIEDREVLLLLGGEISLFSAFSLRVKDSVDDSLDASDSGIILGFPSPVPESP